MRTLLLGMGNPILSDDAIGVRLAADFKAATSSQREFDIVEECSVGGINLLDLLSGYQRVVVLDSLQTSGGTPGACHRFTAEALRETVHLTNIHDANFATALEFGRHLGLPVPDDDEIHIFAVEIEDQRGIPRDGGFALTQPDEGKQTDHGNQARKDDPGENTNQKLHHD